MADKKDFAHFDRSRLTSLTTSIVLLVVSLTPPGKLNELKVFGVGLEPMNRPFLLISLCVAAACSLASLWLSYRNEVSDYLRDKQAAADALTFDEFTKDLQSTIEQVGAISSRFHAFLDDEKIAEAFSTGAVMDSRAIEDYVQRRFGTGAIEDLIQSFVDSSLRISLGTKDAQNYALMSRELNDDLNYNTNGFRDLVELDVSNEEFLISARKFYGLRKDMEQVTNGLVPQLKRLNRAALAQRRVALAARRSHAAELVGLGVLLPVVVFVIALLHALGAIGLTVFDTLPSYVAHLLSKAQ